MGTMKEQAGKAVYLSSWHVKVFFNRGMTSRFLFGTLFLVFCFLFYGVILAFGFLFQQYSSYTPPIANRDSLAFGFLTFFGTGLVYLASSGATGVRNPFIRGRPDAYFFQRVPVEPAVMYFSARLTAFLKNTTAICLFVLPLFAPIMLVLHLPWWRIAGVVAACILTITLCEYIADLAFIILRKYRQEGSWYLIWFELSSPVIGVIVLGVPVIAYLIYTADLVPSFEELSLYWFLPFINSAVAATGFFFRSGVLFESWAALVSLFLEQIVIFAVTTIIALRYKPMEDIAEIMPVLSFLDAQKGELLGGKAIEPPELFDKDIAGKSVFTGKSPLLACIQKDWLAIKRIRVLRRRIILAPFLVAGLTIAFLFIPGSDPASNFLLFVALYPAAEFPLLLSQVEIKDPMQRFPADRWLLVKSKFLFTLLGAGFYGIPLLVAKGLISLVAVVLVAGLGTVIGKLKWGSLMIKRFALLGIAGSSMLLLSLI